MKLITKITLGLTIILALSWIITLTRCNDFNLFAGGGPSYCWEITVFALWGSMIGGPVLIVLWLFIIIKHFIKNKKIKGGRKDGKK